MSSPQDLDHLTLDQRRTYRSARAERRLDPHQLAVSPRLLYADGKRPELLAGPGLSVGDTLTVADHQVLITGVLPRRGWRWAYSVTVAPLEEPGAA